MAGSGNEAGKKPSRESWMEKFARWSIGWAGSSQAFTLAVLTVLVWLVTGPLFGYSDTWQLVINTGTTVVTFLMVFLLQRAQNREAMATQLKLNELVAAVHGASNRLIVVEDLSEEELKVLNEHYRKLSELAKHDRAVCQSHSVEDAVARHKSKRRGADAGV
jgi:low affinity Fe/Cu permease